VSKGNAKKALTSKHEERKNRVAVRARPAWGGKVLPRYGTRGGEGVEGGQRGGATRNTA